MIDAALDHDGHTQPYNDKPAPQAFEVLSAECLDELAELVGKHAGGVLMVDTETVTELVRLYRSIRKVAESVDRIGQIGDALERQIEVAEIQAESQLRRAGQRFEILLHWGAREGLYTRVECAWHCGTDGMRWAGSFDDALEIVRTTYGPKRGTNAFVVVRVPE